LIVIILKRIYEKYSSFTRPETVIGTYFPSEDLPVAHIMTTKELPRYLKNTRSPFVNMPLRERSRLFGSEGSGDSIREGIEKPRYFPFMFVLYHKFR
jgi:hypothetical protein